MFYIGELFINLDDPSYLDNCRLLASYTDYQNAFQWMMEHHTGIMLGTCPVSPRTDGNAVEGYFIDIFKEYRRIFLLINADSYEKAEAALYLWADDYINDYQKTKWLETYEHEPSYDPALE